MFIKFSDYDWIVYSSIDSFAYKINFHIEETENKDDIHINVIDLMKQNYYIERLKDNDKKWALLNCKSNRIFERFISNFIIYARNFKVIDYEQYRNLRKCRS